MKYHTELNSRQLFQLIRSQKIQFAGHRKLKIYGRLRCPHGQRMLNVNRVFFSSREEAVLSGFRPCGHCLKNEFKKWKAQEAG